MRTLVWFRGKDLRVADHAPLADAARRGEVLCLFVLDPFFFAPARARRLPHRMQVLLESLEALRGNLAHLGARLLLAEGRSVDVVPRLARAWKVDRVVAQRWCEPFARERDRRVAAALGVPFELFEGETLTPPGTVRSGAGTPFQVFTPFARALRATVPIAEPLRAPRRLLPPPVDIPHDDAPLPTLASLGIARNERLPGGGEKPARARLRDFLATNAARYPDERNRLDLDSTSRLSVDLHFGTLSPRSVWSAAREALEDAHPAAWQSWSNELLWREFAHHVLWEEPELLDRPHRRAFEAFPWEDDAAGFAAWQSGRTGYPVVDAASRQLLGEGYVHNRARMIAASFVTKDLRVDWRRGYAHYLEFLVDGDWAQNAAGWQWTAGCGFDAAPYFRIFNPVEQGKRFDPHGAYVRRWVPELAQLPARWIHEPWEAPPGVLAAAGVVLGGTYPRPILDHAARRDDYLAAATALKQR